MLRRNSTRSEVLFMMTVVVVFGVVVFGAVD